MVKRLPIIFGLILTALAVWVAITPNRIVSTIPMRLEHLGYDIQLRTRIFTSPKPTLSPVAIIDIDNKSLATEGRWPWSRKKIAALVDALQQQGVAVIAFDIFFAENEENIAGEIHETLVKKNKLDQNTQSLLTSIKPEFDNDAKLAKSLAATQSLLAIGFLPTTQTQNALSPPLIKLTNEEQQQLTLIKALGYISNIPILQNAAKGSGFINILSDIDGIIRHAPLLMEYQGGVYPALSLQAVLTFLGTDIKLITPAYNNEKKLEGFMIGSQVIPTNERGEVLIPFVGGSYTFPYYSATDVLHGKTPKNALLGKIVFVGTSAIGLGDLQATSIQSPFPGVEVQATLVNGLLQNNFSYKPAWTLGANVSLIVLFGLLSTFLFPKLGPRILTLVIILLPLLMLFLNNLIWQKTGLILSFLMPVILVLVIAIMDIIFGYLFETLRRERLKEMFGQYVPQKLIDEMLKFSGNYGFHGEDREMTVMFADIRNFTRISEDLTATELVELLNALFTPMTEIIFKHRGTIDKYIGDLIMAFWGAPLKDKNHARHAIASALDMQARLKNWRAEMAEKNWPEIRLGIGLNSGHMSIGNMGSRYRRNYTVVGDEVNLASRVEGLTKFYGVDIVVTANTQYEQKYFVFRLLDKVRVKGKQHSIDVFEVICLVNDLTDELQQELTLHQQAMDLYFQQQWDQALAIFKQLEQQYPERKIYKIYIARINEFIVTPPPAEWDGVFEHHEK